MNPPPVPRCIRMVAYFDTGEIKVVEHPSRKTTIFTLGTLANFELKSVPKETTP